MKRFTKEQHVQSTYLFFFFGVARGQPSWFLPPWSLSLIYPFIAFLIGACLAVVGLYGSLFSKSVLLKWLVSALAAFFTSAILLEPLKVCMQALIYTVMWGPVDPEVEELLAQETTVVRAVGESSRNIRPPCGYGLLQAKEEARKIQALRSLMRHCVCQLVFLLLVLMVNYQDRLEQTRLLGTTIRQHLHTAPVGSPNLTSLKDWSEAEQWISHTLVKHLHQNALLQLVGLPRLQFTHTPGDSRTALLGHNSSTTYQLLADMRVSDTNRTGYKTFSIDFTQYHRQSDLFVCVSLRLELIQTRGISSFLSVLPLLIPSSSSGLDLHVALMIFLLVSALLIILEELWAFVTERAQYVYQCQHWFQLLLSFLAFSTAVLQLRFLSVASVCVYKIQSKPDSFINFHGAALLAERSSQCAALLLFLLVLKLLGTLRFVRRWVTIGRVLQRAQRELWAVAVLMLLLLLICTHLGNMLFFQSAEGFLSMKESRVSVMSMFCNQRILQKLCTDHPVLGPLYGLLVFGSSIWLLARLCGAALISTYRVKQTELFHLTIEPQDYEMVEFFIKRLKLWMGLTKAKQFRHRVKFEGVDIPPSRSSQESNFSNLSSILPSSCSPSLSPSVSSPHLPVSSEDSPLSRSSLDVQPVLDSLEPIVSTLLSHFDRVNQLTKDVYNLEIQLEEAQERRRKRRISNSKKKETKFGASEKSQEPEEERATGNVRRRKVGLFYPKSQVSFPCFDSYPPSMLQTSAASLCSFPRARSSYSESESRPFQSQLSRGKASLGAGIPLSASHICASSDSTVQFPRRRAWHSGSSHSADAAQRTSQSLGVPPNSNESLTFTNTKKRCEEQERRGICNRLPLKRKAWISEAPEAEEDPIFTLEDDTIPQPMEVFILD